MYYSYVILRLRDLDSSSTPTGQFPPDNCPSRHLPPGQLLPRLLPPRTIAPWTIPSDNSHLVLLYPTRIITLRQLLPRAMIITNYNFSIPIFCFFSMAQLYNFCFDNKNNQKSRDYMRLLFCRNR